MFKKLSYKKEGMDDEKFVREFEKKVRNTIGEYRLLNPDDNVIVACSGGKDSTTVLHLLKKFGHNPKALFIDLLIGEWSKKSRENVEKFCKQNDITLHTVDIREMFAYSICYIRSVIQSKKKLRNCSICGVIKRWMLNKKARELCATKIATGHNLDDEVQSHIMNILRGTPRTSIGLGPKSGIKEDKKFVQRIKPLYFCTNRETERYSRLMGFPVIYEPCPCSVDAFRKEIKEWLNEIDENGDIRLNAMKNFGNITKQLKALEMTEKEIRQCKICGEPSRNGVCRVCSLMAQT